MTLTRDIAWQRLDALQRSSIAYQYAAYGLGMTYDMLPDYVVHQAKRIMVDTIGCAIGGYDGPGRPICEAAVKDLGGHPEATVMGSGLRTSAANANLINCYLVRFLDWNDLSGGGHNSDGIPSLLAVAEREGKGGKDFITSLVVAYELAERVNAGITDWHGWLHETRAGLIIPPAIGRLMGLTVDQIAHAIGITVSGNSVMGQLDAPGEEKVMRKNLRFGWNAAAAITAALFAKHGFTGPVRIFEGEKGMNEIMLQGTADLEAMVDLRGWQVMNTRFKNLCAVVTCQSVLQATLELVREHDIKPADVHEVEINTSVGSSVIRPTIPSKYPRNAETADHSAYYLTAVAIKDREMTQDSVRPDQFTDPVILDLVDRIKVLGDPAIPGKPKVKFVSSVGFEARSKITLKDGRSFERTCSQPKGFWGGPSLTDKELEEKFTGMAKKHLSQQRIQQIFDTLWNLEKLDDIGTLMRLTVF